RVDSSYVWPDVLKQDTYTLAIQRGPEQRRVELQMEVRHDYRNLGGILSNLAASLGFCVVGLLLGLFKPEERVTRFASLTLLAWSNYTLWISLEQMMESYTSWERALVICLNLIHPVQFALSYHFYYRFPASV